MSYTTLASKTRSTKLTLVWVEPVEQLLIWTNVSGSIYKRSVSHYCIDIKEGTTSLTEASSASVTTGEWFFDAEAGEVYINTSDDTDPNTKQIIATYRLFYANAPIVLPHDLTASGNDVLYDGRVTNGGSVSFSLDEEQIGVALESSTSLRMANTDGHFDEFIDKLVFENKSVKVFSWSPSIALSEKRMLFRGIIEDKTVSTSNVGFRCKDEFFKLREPVNLNRFTPLDGSVPDTYLNTPKRRIYGQVKQARCVPTDAILNGFAITGTISGTATSTTITGAGTSFLDEVSPGDTLIVSGEFEDIEIGVESVDSDTQITTTDELEVTIPLSSGAINNPDRPYRKKNRKWHIAGHKLRAPSTTVDTGTQPNRFSVVDGSDFFAGDLIEIDGEEAFIKRISGNQIVLEANLQGGVPSGGDSVSKSPLSKAYIGSREIFVNRDWTITNTAFNAILVLDDNAEFNVAKRRTVAGTLTFTNGSRDVTATGVDLRNEVQSRDWILSDDITHAVWYEILDVQEDSLTLRVAYAGSTTSGTAKKKNVTLLGDDSVVTVNCIGFEDSGNWLRTASDAVNHLLSNDVGTTDLNTASFTQADQEADYNLSYIIPKKIGGDIPTVKSVISEINQSVFGSLTFDSDFNYKYQVLSTERPTDMETLRDDDIIGDYTVSTKNNIIRKVNARYQHFYDFFEGEKTAEFYDYTSSFVDSFVGIRSELDIDIYLFNASDAENIAQRYAFHNSLSQSVVKIKGKLNLAIKGLGDKINLSLDRLYKRFGSNDRQKVVVVNSIRRDGDGAQLELIDVGNAFNRNPAVTANTASDFTSATDGEKILNGYVCDDDLLVPDITSDTELNSQLIG